MLQVTTMFSQNDENVDKSRIEKKLKTCSYNYLEHKITNEYGGRFVTNVYEENEQRSTFKSTCRNEKIHTDDGSDENKTLKLFKKRKHRLSEDDCNGMKKRKISDQSIENTKTLDNKEPVDRKYVKEESDENYSGQGEILIKKEVVESCGEDTDSYEEGEIRDDEYEERYNGCVTDASFIETSEDDDQDEDLNDNDVIIISSDADDDDDEEEDTDVHINDSDLDEMLNENLPEKYRSDIEQVQKKLKANRRRKGRDFFELKRTWMDPYIIDKFDVLPESWTQLFHHIGIPMYYYKIDRIISLAKPYLLGNANIHSHRIPLSAIPCLHQRKTSKKYLVNGEISTRKIGNLNVPICKVESVEGNQITRSLSIEEVEGYVKDKLNFKSAKVKFKINKGSNSECALICPTLPSGTILVSGPIYEDDAAPRRKEWVMNPRGKSHIAVLHEFLRHVLNMQPVYEYKRIPLGDNECSYTATVLLNKERFGTGQGTSKRVAKSNAAKETTEMLIPELKGKLEDGNDSENQIVHKATDQRNVFDEMKITDPRVSELAAKTTEPTPYSMLLNCLRRNYGPSKMKLKYEVSVNKKVLSKFTMVVGKHVVTAHCKNKRYGKQFAAQGVLQALHPQLRTWGSIVRLYGNKSIKRPREKRAEERKITRLQSLASSDTPNFAILNNLMGKLRDLKRNMDERKKTLGVLIQKDVPNMSGINLNSLNYK